MRSRRRNTTTTPETEANRRPVIIHDDEAFVVLGDDGSCISYPWLDPETPERFGRWLDDYERRLALRGGRHD